MINIALLFIVTGYILLLGAFLSWVFGDLNGYKIFLFYGYFAHAVSVVFIVIDLLSIFCEKLKRYFE